MQADLPCVVGIGASAGGLNALIDLFANVPPRPGIAYVVIQHLDPTHASSLSEILRRRTQLAVSEAREDVEIEADQVYVIPPGYYLSLRDYRLHLTKPEDPRGSRMAVDHFFRSLAEELGESSVGVILSGTGTDGTAGLREIKHHGGLTVVQSPDEAQYDGMPRSAIDSVPIDYILPAARIGSRLSEYVDFCRRYGPLSAQAVARSERAELDAILDLLRRRADYDFRSYRKNTLLRRIRRRMGLLQLEELSDYLQVLRDNAAELESLRCDLLIGVTRFFRNARAWELLGEKFLGPIAEEGEHDSPLRVWCAGCATGEEAYSIAILLHERLAAGNSQRRFQIFATDTVADALTTARNGRYPESIARDVSVDRLRRFFVKVPGGYQVSKVLRESIVFAEQNILAQPPFAKLDLIICRNLLIYLEREAQHRVMQVFQFGLKPNGLLFLGRTETLGEARDLFVPVSRKYRLYRRNHVRAWPPIEGAREPASLPRAAAEIENRNAGMSLAAGVHRQLLRDLDRGVVVVNAEGRVLLAEGRTDLYLQLAAGEFSAELPDIMDIARRGLKTALRAAMKRAWAGANDVEIDADVERDGRRHRVRIRIRPLFGRPPEQPAWLVVLTPSQNVVEAADAAPGADTAADRGPADEPAFNLEQELATTRHELDASISDLESANEELKASNEEAMAMNEELQSSNEELETSKEELQALNEELTTLNSQLEIKVREFEEANNDLENSLTSSDVPTIFLDPELRIRRYTPSCRELIHFVSGDIGRPLSDMKAQFDDPALIDDAQAVLDDLQPREKKVQSLDGQRWYRRRALPYRTEDNRIQGVVITLTDITDLIRAQQELNRQLALNQNIYDSAPIGLGFLDTELRYLNVNPRLAEINGLSVERHIGRKLSQLLPDELLTKVLPTIEQVLESGEPAIDLEIVGRTKASSEDRTFLASYVPVTASGELLGIDVVVQDITVRKKAEEELRKSEELVSTIAQNSTQALIMMDETGHLIYCNQAWIDMCGYDAKELRSKPLHDLVHHHYPDGRPYPVSGSPVDQPLPEDFSVRAHEDLFFRKDGSTFPVLCAASPIFEDGKPVSTVLEVRDISAIKQAERELTQREAHLRRVINHQLGLVGVVDRDGVLVEVDDRSLEIAHVDRKDVIGKPFADAPWWSYDPDVQQRMRDTIDRALAGEIVRYDVSLFAHGAEGVMIDFMMAPIIGDDGEVEYLVPSGIDIADRKLAEEKLRASEERLRLAAAATGFGTYDFDPGSRTSIWSDELYDLFHLSIGDYPGGRVRVDDLPNLVHPDDRRLVERMLESCVDPDGPGRHDVVYRLVLADGETRWVRDVGQSIIEGEDGSSREVIRVVGTVQDISEQKRIAEALKESDRRKDEFLATLSHELRNPLAPLRSGLEVIEASGYDRDVVARTQKVMARQLGHLVALVDDLLDVSRISNGKLKLRTERVELKSVLQDAINICTGLIESAGHRLQVDQPEEAITVDGDPHRLSQVLANLINNAVRYTPEGGNIQIAVRRDNGEAVISVEDDGIGIAEQELARVFDMFAQIGADQTAGMPGLGVGLSLAKSLVEMHGGSIEAFSEGEGQGARFELRLPRSHDEAPEPPAASSSEASDTAAPPASHRILVVDDNQDAAQALGLLIEKWGNQVRIEGDGHAALSAARDFRPDLIIMDIGMPVMDGYAAAKAIRSESWGSDVTLVALTGWGQDSDLEKATAAGFDRHVLKPLSSSTLTDLLTDVLGE